MVVAAEIGNMGHVFEIATNATNLSSF